MEFFIDEENGLIIIVKQRYPKLDAQCYNLKCGCKCGNGCDIEENETLSVRFPHKEEITREKAIEVLKNNNCEHLLNF